MSLKKIVREQGELKNHIINLFSQGADDGEQNIDGGYGEHI